MKKNEGEIAIKKIGMVGVGSMGSMMSLLFAEHGAEVHFYDPSEDNVKTLQDEAKNIGAADRIVHQKDYKELCDSLSDGKEPRTFVFSIPHGKTGDKTVEGLRPFLTKGDLIIDCSNEHWENTERRQSQLEPDGIHYVGCGVSGGYHSARHGPSCSPGGSEEGLKRAMPFLRQIAARDNKDRPCTNPVGPGGSGHYVKMVHNGIEQGMMSVLAEAWYILTKGLQLSYEEVGSIFEQWNKDGPLHDCFLVDIGADICRMKDEKGEFVKKGEYVLAHVRDKVVQDVDETEGTGYWTCEQGVMNHVPIATIAAAHLFRCASADAGRRIQIQKSFGGGVKPQPIKIESRDQFVKELENAVYGCFLMCFAQGLLLIKKMDKKKGWEIKYSELLQLWRGGCIIQADYIVDLLQRMYDRNDHDDDDILANKEIGSELSKSFPALKNVVLRSVEADMYIPAISQSLEFYKYSGSTELPTQFMEAELDYFGAHNFDLKEGPSGKPQTGELHFSWKPAKGIFGE